MRFDFSPLIAMAAEFIPPEDRPNPLAQPVMATLRRVAVRPMDLPYRCLIAYDDGTQASEEIGNDPQRAEQLEQLMLEVERATRALVPNCQPNVGPAPAVKLMLMSTVIGIQYVGGEPEGAHPRIMLFKRWWGLRRPDVSVKELSTELSTQ